MLIGAYWCCGGIRRVPCKDTFMQVLTLTLPGPSAGVSGSLDSYCSLKPLCSGMGEVVVTVGETGRGQH